MSQNQYALTIDKNKAYRTVIGNRHLSTSVQWIKTDFV